MISKCWCCGGPATIEIRLPDGDVIPAENMIEAQELLRKHQRQWPNEDLSVQCHSTAPKPVPVQYAELTLQELRNIVNAKRFDREIFSDDTEFADWATSRARHTIRKVEERGVVGGVLPAKDGWKLLAHALGECGIYPQAVSGSDGHDYEKRGPYEEGWNDCAMYLGQFMAHGEDAADKWLAKARSERVHGEGLSVEAEHRRAEAFKGDSVALQHDLDVEVVASRTLRANLEAPSAKMIVAGAAAAEGLCGEHGDEGWDPDTMALRVFHAMVAALPEAAIEGVQRVHEANCGVNWGNGLCNCGVNPPPATGGGK